MTEAIHLIPAMPGYAAVLVYFHAFAEEGRDEPTRDDVLVANWPLVGWRYQTDDHGGWLEPLVPCEKNKTEDLLITQPDGSVAWPAGAEAFPTLEKALDRLWRWRIGQWRRANANAA